MRRIIVCLSVLLVQCQSLDQSNSQGFHGDSAAVVKAHDMFNAIGGLERWCEVRSLYIKAEHAEPQMSMPYQSEIWRALDTFQLVIEQQNSEFHVRGIFTEDRGHIRYLDQRDTFRLLSDEQLADWKFNHAHNVYVLLHQLACNPNHYLVELGVDEQLSFYQDSIFIVRLGLDEQNRPHLFYQPTPDDTISGSRFTRWEEDQGLVHSAGGHPLDSNFWYVTELWEPSNNSFIDTYGLEIMNTR